MKSVMLGDIPKNVMLQSVVPLIVVAPTAGHEMKMFVCSRSLMYEFHSFPNAEKLLMPK
jgi:hypothetical protein